MQTNLRNGPSEYIAETQEAMYSWAVYAPRDDGDYDLVAVYPSDSERMIDCPVSEIPETLAFHLCHEAAAEYESTCDESPILSFSGDHTFVSVLEAALS